MLKRKRFPDYDAYPIVFLYRHAFELSIKNIIYRSVRLIALRELKDISEKLYNTHDLIKLAENVRMILLKAYPDDDSLHKFVQDVVSASREFSEIDPASFSYRYPIDAKGNCSNREGQSINLSSLSGHMKDILEELDTISFGLNIETDNAEEVYEVYIASRNL